MSLVGGVSGDVSPARLEGARQGHAPIQPHLLIAFGLGLASVDVPPAAIAEVTSTTWKFPHPVLIGDTVTTHVRVAQKRSGADDRVGIVVWQVEIRNQHGVVCAQGDMSTLVERSQGEAVVPVEPKQENRSRRRRGPRAVAPPSPVPPSDGSETTEAPAETPAAAAPEPSGNGNKRRRRRRGGRGRGGRSHATGEAGAPTEGAPDAHVEAAPAPPPAPAPVPEPEPLPVASPPQPPPAADDKSPIGRVLKRLRRT